MGDSGKERRKARAKADKVVDGAALREVVLAHDAAHGVKSIGMEADHQVMAGALSRAAPIEPNRSRIRGLGHARASSRRIGQRWTE
jgi:hypothetical protein